jgi:hypothetical protein
VTDTTQKTSRKAPEAAAGAEETKSGWYRLHFLRNQTGPCKVITRIGAGMARFKASQTDPEAEDFPTKVVKLTEAEAAAFKPRIRRSTSEMRRRRSRKAWGRS